MTIVAICSLAYLLDGLIHTLMRPLAPAIARELGLSSAQLGPILFMRYGIGSTLAGVVSVLFVLGGWRGSLAVIEGICLFAAVIAWLWLEVPDC